MGISRCSILGVLLVLLIPLSGCESISVGKRLKRMSDHPVVFPSSLKRIDGVNNIHQNLDSQLTRLVVYIDSLNCSSCGINRLSRFLRYAALTEANQGFQFIVVIWPDSESKETIVNNIEHKKFPFDVYVDYDGCFSKSNQNLPRGDARFHVFLLDKDNKPIMIGDPTSSKRMELLFKEHYNNCLT